MMTQLPLGSPAHGSPTFNRASTPPPGGRKERALDNWRLGESLRIMHHIEPKKYRAISLHGEVYQGHYRQDWQPVEHIQRLRNLYPAVRQSLNAAAALFPFPQGMTQQEIVNNRGWERSLGSSRLPGGMMTVGSQTMIP